MILRRGKCENSADVINELSLCGVKVVDGGRRHVEHVRDSAGAQQFNVGRDVLRAEENCSGDDLGHLQVRLRVDHETGKRSASLDRNN